MADGPNPLGMLAPDAAKKGGGGFGAIFASKPTDTGPPAATMNSVIDEVNNASRRVRVLEDRFANLRNKVQVIEQNMLDSQKKSLSDVQSIQDDIMRVKRAMAENDNKVATIIKELQSSAKKEDVEVLKKVLDLWEPLQFVTRAQAERMINEAIQMALLKITENMPEYTPKLLSKK